MATTYRHLPELQAIRGLAALTVVLHHCSFVFVTGDGFRFWAEVLANAHAAVMMFFVLSGYVLVRSLHERAPSVRSYARFCMQRACRIFPALWCACMLTAGYFLAFRPEPSGELTSAWYRSYVIADPGLHELLRNMSLLGFPLLPPTWSIRVELLAAAVIPFVALMVSRQLGFWLLLAATALALLVPHPPGGLVYLPSFVLGALAFHYQDRLGPRLGNAPVLILLTGALLFFRRLDPAWRFDTNYNAVPPMLVESLAAAGILVSVAHREIPLLRHRLIARLGDISYSLYLVHFTVMTAMAGMVQAVGVNAVGRTLLLSLGTLAVSWPLAAWSYRFVEQPGVSLGRRLTAQLGVG